ncbi:MAG: response regulator HsfA [Myxococcales bacterium]|nr:response regulator HsfA [Myxococcales bacterium]
MYLREVSELPDWSAADLAATAGAAGRRATVPPRLRLVVLSGPDRGKELVLTHGTYFVGKHPRCALVLADARVSRRHLELRIGADGVEARDLGSRNGSYFRGARFSEIVVGTSAVITIGDSELTILSDESQTPMLPSEAESFHGLRGRSLAMRQIFALVERIAPSDALVLIEGETGTGKEVCAEAIHAGSARAAGPFVVCDLGAITRGLLEADLFGHARGAFSGAERERAGAFESAHGGTLFLDEIGELEPDVQPRLLRAIERLQVARLGETHHRTVDVRLIVATNRDLAEEVKAGRFREDLYHRLSVARVRLPPLRERKDDLPLLVETLLAGERQLLPETLTLLGEYDWPGNVRELANVLERARAMAQPGEPLAPAHLGLGRLTGRRSGGEIAEIEDFHLGKEQLVEEWERDFLRRLLAAASDNLSHAARTSGLGRAHLYRLLKKYKMG